VPNLRRLLAVLLLAGACVLVGPVTSGASAAPCTCAKSTTDDYLKEANAVFTGTVQEITPAGDGTAATATSRTSTVLVDRVYTGDMITTETVEVVTPRAFGTCTRDLEVGKRYMFFVESDEGFTATGCGGTRIAIPALVNQVELRRGPGRPPVVEEPGPVEVTFTPANTDEPTSLTRLAAPGLALVIIGLLGLAVVRRLARPRP
jgi:hypothetical protein